MVLLVELNCRHVKRKSQDRGPIKRWADKRGDEWTQWCVKWERERKRRLTRQGDLKAWQDEKRKEEKEKVIDCLNLSRLNIQICFGIIKKGFFYMAFQNTSMWLDNWPFIKTRPLSYCCYVRRSMALSHHTSCSHAVWNTSRSKEETENALTDKTEQDTIGMKQSHLSDFVIL